MSEQQDLQENVPNEINRIDRKSNSSLFKRSVIILIVVVLIALCSAAVYYWQHQKLVTANNTIDSLNGTNKTLSTNLTNLQSKYTQAENSLKAYQTSNNTPVATQSDLGLVVNAAEYVNPDGTVTSGGSWFGVRMTLTNSTTSPIDLTASNFSLKDSNGNVYKVVGYTGATTLPDGWGANTLQDQVITAGSSITGEVIFQMANKDITSFTLLNSTKSYPVSVQ